MLQRLKAGPKSVLMTVDAVGGVWRYAMDLAHSLKPYGTRFVFAGIGPQPTDAQRHEAEMLGDLVWLDAPADWLTDDDAALDELPKAIEALASDVELIHLNAPSQAAGLKTSVPVIAVSHSCVPTWFATVKQQPCPPYWCWQATRNKEGLRTVDIVIAPSQSHADALASVYGETNPVEVIYNGSRSIASTEREKHPYVLAGGRWWDEGKNGAVLDAAAADVEWPVLAAGAVTGPNGQHTDFEELESLGPLESEIMQRRLAEAGIVVSPSIYEPFGLVPLEGARAGAALVLADIPTYRELWEGAALFADPRNPAAFSNAINTLISNSQLRTSLSRESQERSASYTLERQAEAMWDLYCSLVRQHAH